MNVQEYLLYITALESNRLNSNKIRCVTAYWKDKTAYISFYFQGELIDDEVEAASDVCTYIIAHFPDGLLEEKYIRWDYPKPLPTQFLAYKRDED
ncbi:MAG: hypothetical protein ACH350_10560 [Parachlamydiaceae bacterium]